MLYTTKIITDSAYLFPCLITINATDTIILNILKTIIVFIINEGVEGIWKIQGERQIQKAKMTIWRLIKSRNKYDNPSKT